MNRDAGQWRRTGIVIGGGQTWNLVTNVTQRPSDPGIQRLKDPVDPVTLFYNELESRNVDSSRKLTERVYTAIFEKNMRNSTLNYLIPDWSTAVT